MDGLEINIPDLAGDFPLDQEAVCLLDLEEAHLLVPVEGFLQDLVAAYLPVPAEDFLQDLVVVYLPDPAEDYLPGREVVFLLAPAEDFLPDPVVDYIGGRHLSLIEATFRHGQSL